MLKQAFSAARAPRSPSSSALGIPRTSSPPLRSRSHSPAAPRSRASSHSPCRPATPASVRLLHTSSSRSSSISQTLENAVEPPQPSPTLQKIAAAAAAGVKSVRSAAAGAGRNPVRTTAGPLVYYEDLLASGKLRADEHQRSIVMLLQDLYERVIKYQPPPVVSVKLEDYDVGNQKVHHVGVEAVGRAGSIVGILSDLFSSHKKAPAQEIEAKLGPQGLYLWGDVGTGKTMVMDLFYNSIPIERKRRIHFHAFMHDVHRRIHAARTALNVKHQQQFDAIPPIAQELANEAWLLCFDELQVTDISDAMILRFEYMRGFGVGGNAHLVVLARRRLFTELFNRGTVMVTTSNRPPDDLYKNGIQRSSFVPTIDLLKERCLVHTLNSGIDYRRQKREKVGVFMCPLNEETKAAEAEAWRRLTHGQEVKPRSLQFLGRSLDVPEATDSGCAKVSFAELCGEAHSAADYLELVKHFRVVMVTDVPTMTLTQRNEARRFITLLDALYENRVALLMSADADDIAGLFSSDAGHNADVGGGVHNSNRLLMDDLNLGTDHLSSPIFTGAEETFAFQRAVSRLVEMQSVDWVGKEVHDRLTSPLL
ncbi:AFG1-like ATPase-domain-containing protein [Cladochytrium replicatum]|nr:AFG1-like ATPase-domain-containing protein [Cladochytrium replicatum]